MSSFTSPFVGELIGKNKWRVYVPFEYHIGAYPSKTVIYVPVGFVTDFASIPRIFWPFISPIDEHGKAAVVHDYLYTIGYFKKSVCDKIYLEALTVLKVSKIKRTILYYGVKYFGWYRWFKCRIKDKRKIF
jgi:hypothetical protein